MKKIPLNICLLFCLLVSAQAQDSRPTEISPPVPGSIHSDQLRRIMLRLNELAFEREYTELGLDRLRAEQVEALVGAANTLLRNSGRLPEILSEGMLNEEEQTTFTIVARLLYNETLRIQTHVHANEFEYLTDGYRRLQQICNACHQLFRFDNQ